MKDDRGLVLYKSQVPLGRAIGTDTTKPMSQRRLAALFDSLRASHIYPVARIVVAKDPLLANPNAHPYGTVDRALKDMKKHSAGITNAARIVPWYQSFTLGPPHYGAQQVRAQIKAGYDNGFFSWILWNPGSKYDTAALKPH